LLEVLITFPHRTVTGHACYAQANYRTSRWTFCRQCTSLSLPAAVRCAQYAIATFFWNWRAVGEAGFRLYSSGFLRKSL